MSLKPGWASAPDRFRKIPAKLVGRINKKNQKQDQPLSRLKNLERTKKKKAALATEKVRGRGRSSRSTKAKTDLQSPRIPRTGQTRKDWEVRRKNIGKEAERILMDQMDIVVEKTTTKLMM